MDVNFEYYRIFYYVAKYRNFTKAAHALHNSQPNITRAMNCLEREIHCTLFIRTNRGVRLTEEGEKLFRHVSAAMMQILAAEEELTESAELEKGCVSISASEIALNIFLLEKLKKFHMAYPKVQLKLYNHSTPQAIHAVQSGEADFADSRNSGRGGHWAGCARPWREIQGLSGYAPMRGFGQAD